MNKSPRRLRRGDFCLAFCITIRFMTADTEQDIQALKAIGHICAETLRKMMEVVRPGMTTGELDDIGRGLLESVGARSAPEVAY